MGGIGFLIVGFLMVGSGLWFFINHLIHDKTFQYYKRMFLLVVDVLAGLFFITPWA